ncbi:hypothetical protein [Paenarthrobacter nitroguajacolicus]|uniref:hypothetical protein n=1 Tax=Paenarthrobacter nitroguajacolicus TaxID=211146 RepID=UPI0028607654|nr:hypothetical protein [Paenarthrobacter nitroguajacolicus]MDR6639078.1 hypothetical protein [Paenarthrobacter nitroguajacolicus]
MGTLSSRVQGMAGATFAGLFRAIKVARPHRPIHPTGIHLVGTLKRDPGQRRPSGIPWLDGSGTNPVNARLSRSIGLPDALPDIIGLAIRFTEHGKQADMLLATTGPTGIGRFILRLRRNAASAVFSSMMPYKSMSGPVLIAARTIEGPGKLPVEPRAFRAALGRGPWTLKLHHASPLGPWCRLGTLTLTVADHGQDSDERFDPVLNPLPGAGTYDWTRRLREPSYALARQRG